MEAIASAQVNPSARRRWVARVTIGVVVACLLAAAAGCLLPQSSAVEAGELVIEPQRLGELRTFDWRRLQVPESFQPPEQADASAGWEAFGGESDRHIGVYGEDVYRLRNGLVARGYYHYFAKRRIFENNFPGSVVDADKNLALKADQFDVYCVDIDAKYVDDHSGCGVWNYWARYSQFVVWISFDNQRLGLDDVRFQNLVKQIDELLAISLNHSQS